MIPPFLLLFIFISVSEHLHAPSPEFAWCGQVYTLPSQLHVFFQDFPPAFETWLGSFFRKFHCDHWKWAHISWPLPHVLRNTGGWVSPGIYSSKLNRDGSSLVSSLFLSISFDLKANCASVISAFWLLHVLTLDLFLPGERDSACYGSVFQGQFEGTIHTGNDTYHVESVYRYSHSKTDHHSIIYHEKDLGRNNCSVLFHANMLLAPVFLLDVRCQEQKCTWVLSHFLWPSGNNGRSARKEMFCCISFLTCVSWTCQRNLLLLIPIAISSHSILSISAA